VSDCRSERYYVQAFAALDVQSSDFRIDSDAIVAVAKRNGVRQGKPTQFRR
jgi:hypothetical protein